MYALIREYKNLDPTMRENAARKASSELRPILSKTQGFVSYELLTPQDDQNAVTSISVFRRRPTPRLRSPSRRTGFRRTCLR